jgi:hypothetical protein
MATLIQVEQDGPLTTYYYAENVVMVENAQTGDVSVRKLPDPMALIREQMLMAHREQMSMAHRDTRLVAEFGTVTRAAKTYQPCVAEVVVDD